MCEIFSAIGASLLASAGIGGASASAATAVGAAAAASTIAGVASTGIGIANSIRSANSNSSRLNEMQNSLLNRTNRFSTEKTAAQLKDNSTAKRTITSLRIPLDKTSNSNTNVQSNQNVSGLGLNIPV